MTWSSDARPAKQYRRTVRLIGVDISLEKSMLSGRWSLLHGSFLGGLTD